jgi:hypothetical protein
MKVEVCPTTGMPYVIIDGKMFVCREPLAKSMWYNGTADFIKRIGQGNGHDYHELEMADPDEPIVKAMPLKV